MIFGEIDSFFSLLGKAKKFFSKEKEKQTEELVSTRFIRIFEKHGVSRNQIPRFFGKGLTVADVKDDVSLLQKLTEEVLNSVCEMFGIRREWLDGAESQIYSCKEFYPKYFLNFLENLKFNSKNQMMHGVIIKPEKNFDADAILILQETIGYIGDKSIYRYHLCNNWPFSYWKSRVYLTACVAIAWKLDVYIHGITKPKSYIEQIAQGETFLDWQDGGIWGLGVKTWNPEEMAINTEAFLKDIDPEIGNFGLKAGLKLWLELNSEGLMDTGFSPNVRDKFATELEKYESNC